MTFQRYVVAGDGIVEVGTLKLTEVLVPES
jgi:hypothetical protein